MKMLFTLLFVLLATLSYVSAHGYVSEIAIDGTWYAGNPPNLDTYKGEHRAVY